MAVLEPNLIQQLLADYPFRELLAQVNQGGGGGGGGGGGTALAAPPARLPTEGGTAGLLFPPRAPTSPNPAEFDPRGMGSQDVAMSDPKYAEMVALSLLSQGMIPTAKGFVPGDTPNARLELPDWMKESNLWGQHPAAPTGAGFGLDRASISQPRRGTLSVMGGPQVGTLGDLANVGKLIKDLPPAFQNAILQRITGLSAIDPDFAKQAQLAKFKHQLEAPERREKLDLQREALEDKRTNRDAQLQLRQQMLDMQNEQRAGKEVQFLNLMRAVIDSDNAAPGLKQAASVVLQQGMQRLLQRGAAPAGNPEDLLDGTSGATPPPTTQSPVGPRAGQLRSVKGTWKQKE